MRNVILVFLVILNWGFGQAQTVEVQGQLKVTTVNQNNASTDILVRNTDGTVGKRDAGTIGGVPISGIVLSETELNANLTNAGYTKIGNFTMDITSNWMGLPTSILTPRIGNIATFNGTEIIIWGGANYSSSTYFGDGAKFNPTTGNWSAISTVGAPTARAGATAVLDAANNSIIVWGGYSSFTTPLNDGAIYNYNTNTWTPIPPALPNTPTSRYGHTATWTGTEMIIWGGYNFSIASDDGAAYNPVSNTWTTLPSSILTARWNHTSEWTGTEMIIWGGEANVGVWPNNGARFNPTSGTWTALPTSILSDRKWHRSINTGMDMIIWGGLTYNDGAKYNYSSNTWTLLSLPPPTMTARWYHYQTYIGNNKMIIWGGYDGTNSLSDGALYDISSDTWTTMNPINAPTNRELGLNTTCIWGNNRFYVWGGGSRPPLTYYNDGWQYSLDLPNSIPMFLFKKN